MKWWIWVLMVVAVVALWRELTAEDNNITGTAPTERTDGEPLNDLDVIRIYHGTDGTGGPYPNLIAELSDVGPGEQFGFLHTDQPDGMHCYISTAVDLEGNESAPSNEACKLVDTIAPGSPTDLAVQ